MHLSALTNGIYLQIVAIFGRARLISADRQLKSKQIMSLGPSFRTLPARKWQYREPNAKMGRSGTFEKLLPSWR